MVERGGVDVFPGRVAVVDGDDPALEIDGEHQGVEAVEFHVAVHRGGDGIGVRADLIPVGFGVDGVIEAEGLDVAVAFEEVAIDGGDDRLAGRAVALDLGLVEVVHRAERKDRHDDERDGAEHEEGGDEFTGEAERGE